MYRARHAGVFLLPIAAAAPLCVPSLFLTFGVDRHVSIVAIDVFRGDIILSVKWSRSLRIARRIRYCTPLNFRMRYDGIKEKHKLAASGPHPYTPNR